MTNLNLYRDIATRSQLEREYSPSSCVADLGAILETYGRKSSAVRQQLPRLVKSYGDTAAEEFDFFAAPSVRNGGGPRPVLVYIHGGYWQELSKNEHSFPALALNAHDISYVAVNYGLAPEAKLGEMVTRCRRALAWVSKHADALKIDRAQVHLAGCSAGAHLAAMVALTDWTNYGVRALPLRSLILLSGIYDLRPLPLTYVNNAVGMSLEDTLNCSPQLLIDAAQVLFPRTLIIWGEHETAEFKRQSRDFADSISRRGAAVVAEEIAGRNHFDLIFDLADDSTRFGALSLQCLEPGR